MNLGSDPADQIVRYTLEGTEVALKLSGLAAKNFALFVYAVLKDQKKTRGKTRLVRMLKEQRPFKFFQIPQEALREFAKEARAHGLLYVPIRNKRDDGQIELVVFADDAAKVQRVSGARAVWKEVLAVYAVKTTTDADGADVASVDEKKIRLLSEVFWEMNEITSSVEARTEMVVDTATGEDGEMVDTETAVTQDVLVITVSHKTAWEMADLLRFDKSQREQLRELLSEEYDDLWNELLYGIALASGNGDLVAIAQSQVGNMGGAPYWSWYGFNSRVEWCAIFVSWCAGQCGLLDSGAVPKFAGVGTGVQWFQSRGQWLDGPATPEPGMIIFFQWYGSDSLIADHVGIVERVEDGRIYTIEGNSDNMVRQNSYPVGYGEIKGYGAVAP